MVDGSTNETWLGSLLPGHGAKLSSPGGGLVEIPERIGPYMVEELVGRGGMAAVYRCRDEAGEEVAVKWLNMPSPALEQRFALEIRALSRVHHPSVVRWLGQGCEEGRPYLVMEYLDGDDLRLWTFRSRRLPMLERRRRIRALAVRLCEALGSLHALGLVHRDVKPSNVLVLEQDLPVLTDFGVVKDLADDGETAVGVVVGTLNYAAPEQLRGGAVDARTDLYGLGCTLYFMLTGRVPFAETAQAELVLAHLERAPVPPSHFDPTISADLEQVVLRLMAKEPAERYASATEAAAALSATPTPAGTPLAGRKRALQRVAEALEQVAGGAGCLVRVSGRPGTGKGWAVRTLQEGALRRGLPFLEPREPAALVAAQDRLAQGEALLVVTELPVPEPDLRIRLEPLRRADMRRSVVAVAPMAKDPAALAERLYRATGGLPVLLVPLLELLQADPCALDGELPPIPVESWLDKLDLDTLEVLQVVSASPVPLSAAEIESVIQVPADEPLLALLDAGVVVASSTGHGQSEPSGRYGRRFVVSAGAFAIGALERAPEPEVLRERITRICAPLRAGATASPPGLRQIHELLDAAQLQAAEVEIGELRRELAGVTDPARSTGLLLAQARLDWYASRPEQARAGFAAVNQHARQGSRADLTARLGLGVLDQQEGRPREATAALDAVEADAHVAGELDLETLAALQAAWGRALLGRPGPGLRRVYQLVGVARALGHPSLECAALEVQGRLLLEVGLPDEAARCLADASALSRAAGLGRERWQAHVLRARATLDSDPGSPTSAAAATDRLLRVLGEPPQPDPLGFQALAHALLARAAARLSDSRTCAAAQLRAMGRLEGSRAPLAFVARLQLVRAAWIGGQAETARRAVAELEREAAALGLGFLAWQARKLDAAMRGTDPEPASPFLEGMEPRWAAALSRESDVG